MPNGEHAVDVPVVRTRSPVQFVLRRANGGADIRARVAVWSGVDTPLQKRVAELLFLDALDELETFSRSLDPGTYVCVFRASVVEDLNGEFHYVHSVGTDDVFENEGNVDSGAATGEGQAFRDEYVLHVEAP